MRLRRLINLLIAVFLTAGLLAAPFATPALAVPPPAPMQDEMAGAAADMDMPCCPAEKQNDCSHCPFLALCTFAIAVSTPSSASEPALPQPLLGALVGHDDLFVAGLGEHPPDHPPRPVA